MLSKAVFLGESEPMYGILSSLMQIVPDCSWSFARIESNGELCALLGSGEHRHTLQNLAEELKQQRSVAMEGPRIAASMCTAGESISGVTLVFAEQFKHFGILIIERTSSEQTFSSSEISMLTLGLSDMSERLAALRLKQIRTKKPNDSYRYVKPKIDSEAFYALNFDYQIMLAWTAEEDGGNHVVGLQSPVATRLPRVLENSVRNLTSTWSAVGEKIPGVASPLPFLILRTESLSGPLGRYIGVRIDRLRSQNSLVSAAAQFRISPRELQVLTLLLNGDRLETISDQLSITSSTVQDHINSMLYKTESENRSELIARILGWESASHPHCC